MHPENWLQDAELDDDGLPVNGEIKASYQASLAAMREVLNTLAQKESSARTDLLKAGEKGKVAVIHDDLHITRTGRTALMTGKSIGRVQLGTQGGEKLPDGQFNNVKVRVGIPSNAQKVSMLFEIQADEREAMQERRVAQGGHRVSGGIMDILADIYEGDGGPEEPDNRPREDEGFELFESNGRTFTDGLASELGFVASAGKSPTVVMLEAFDAAGVPFNYPHR